MLLFHKLLYRKQCELVQVEPSKFDQKTGETHKKCSTSGQHASIRRNLSQSIGESFFLIACDFEQEPHTVSELRAVCHLILRRILIW